MCIVKGESKDKPTVHMYMASCFIGLNTSWRKIILIPRQNTYVDIRAVKSHGF